jgi:hypothetical protein
MSVRSWRGWVALVRTAGCSNVGLVPHGCGRVSFGVCPVPATGVVGRYEQCQLVGDPMVCHYQLIHDPGVGAIVRHLALVGGAVFPAFVSAVVRAREMFLVPAAVGAVVDGDFPAFACCSQSVDLLMSLRRGCSRGTGGGEECSPNKCGGNAGGCYMPHRLDHGFLFPKRKA